MALEVSCGACQQVLLVENFGVVVECPHCGAHLQIDAPEEPAASAGTASNTAVAAGPASSIVLRAGTHQAIDLGGDELPAGTSPAGILRHTEPAPATAPIPDTRVAAAPPPVVQAPPAVVEPPPVVVPPPVVAAAPAATAAFPLMTPPAPAPQPPANVAVTSAPAPQPALAPVQGMAFTPIAGPPPAAPPPAPAPLFTVSEPMAAAAPEPPTPVLKGAAEPPADFDPSQFVPKKTFFMVVSYASALTLALLYLFFTGRLGIGNPDLPDIKPPTDSRGRVQSKLMPENLKLPPEHILRLGQSHRYGNIQITPVRVTRGPLNMVNIADSSKTKSGSRDVMKLWVKFENISSDQTIAPIDRHLLFQRFPDKKNEARVRANNFICQASQKNRDGNKVMVYEMPIKGEWNLRDDPVGEALGPGKECEIYIPTNDGDLSKLTGDIVWRLHFRKGYNPSSKRGVTTVVEVRFNTRDVKDDA
jgi:hypothetical protein